MNIFSQSWIFFLCATIAVGYFIGNLKYKGLFLGSSAILFVGIAFGKMGASLVPSEVGGLGLLIFLYALGTDSGPTFIRALKGKGLQFSFIAVLFTTIAIITVFIFGLWFKVDPATMAGIYAGAMVSSPALAGILDSVSSYQAALVTTAYSLLYPIGVLVSIFYTQCLIYFDKQDIKKAEEELNQKLLFENPPIRIQCLEIYPPRIMSIRELHSLFYVRVTHIIPAGRKAVAPASALLKVCPGDKIRLLGSNAALEKVKEYLQAKITSSSEFKEHARHYQLIVTRKEACGSRVMDLATRCHMATLMFEHANRNDVDIPLSPRTRLHMGDVLHVNGDPQQIEELRKLVGDDPRELNIADFMPVMFVIAIGWLLGNIPITIGQNASFIISSSAGVLITAIVLSNIRKVGAINFYVPQPSVSFLKEIGLALFFASTGLSAGSSLTMRMLLDSGSVVVSGLAVSVIPMVITWLFIKRALRLNYLYALGSFTGARAVVASLAIATSITKTPYVATTYSIVFPIVTLLQIISSKLIYTIGLLLTP